MYPAPTDARPDVRPRLLRACFALPETEAPGLRGRPPAAAPAAANSAPSPTSTSASAALAAATCGAAGDLA
eukprot:355912-Chlamydomonas_euryale.AAC.3